MLIHDHINGDSLRCRIGWLLLLLLIAIFATAPVVDADTDFSFTLDSVFNDFSDSDGSVSADFTTWDDRKSFEAMQSSKPVAQHAVALVQPAPIDDISVRPDMDFQVSVYVVKSSQTYSPATSDLSPPAV